MTEVLRAVIADDEPLSLRRLELGLAQTPGVELAGAARDGRQAVQMIQALQPDIVLLDIKMPGLDGLEVLRAITPERAPAVIYVTAYDRHATAAFELEAVDYLLKPFDFERLRQAIERARRKLQAGEAAARLDELRRSLEALGLDTIAGAAEAAYDEAIWVPDRRGRVKVPVRDIDWIQAERDYVRVHVRGRSYLLRGSLQAIAAKLDPERFAQVHRSALVRLDRVEKTVQRPTSGWVLVLSTGAEVPVGRTYVRALRGRLPF